MVLLGELTDVEVRAAVLELGYRPSASARALRRGRSDEICVAFNLEPFFIEVMRAMHELPYEDIAAALGLSLAANKVRIHRARRALLERRSKR